jgi:ABC-type sugar transport system permease subunit
LYILGIVLAVSVAWLVRWRAVTMLPVDYDEDDYLRAAQQYAALIRTGNMAGFLETNYRSEHPPLAKIIYGLSILPAPEAPLIPDEPTSASPNQYLPKQQLRDARTVAAVFGTLEDFLVALVNPLAALLLAINTFTIKYTSQVMLEALPSFTSLATVLFYVRFKRKKKMGWLVASAIFLGLTAASKYLYCVVGIAILVDWFLVNKNDGELKRFFPMAFLWGLLSVGVFFAVDPYLWPAPIERLKESVFYLGNYSLTAPEVQNAGYPFWQPLFYLAESIPWHPGVFVVSVDALVSILAIVGLSRLWRKERTYILWLGIALFFLLIWPTKWPQYILILTAPLSLSAAEGIWGLVVEPVKSAWQKRGQPKPKREIAPVSWRETVRSVPWLLPGIIALGALILFPLLYQLAMAFTDFSGPSILDGIRGGILRAVWQGFTGQVKAIEFGAFGNGVHFSKIVNFAGPNLLLNIFSSEDGRSLLVFELLWTALSVGCQAMLGISLALVLNRPGVRFVNFWRTIFILPWAIPEFIGALIWLRTFDPSAGWVAQASGSQLVSNLLSQGGPSLSLAILLIAATWGGFPFIMLAASASLKLVPKEAYDAAAIDGAAGWGLFRHITWPLLMPLVVPALIIRGIMAFNQFYLFYVMPTRLTTFATVSYFIFKDNNQYAVSAAINIFTVVILIFLLFLFNRWGKAAEGVSYA